MIEHRFEIEGEPDFEVRLPVGDLRVVAAKDEHVLVTLDGRQSAIDRFVVERRGDTVHIEPDGTRLRGWSHVDLTLHIPAPARLHARLTSADLYCDVELGQLAVESASGDVSVGRIAGDCTIKTASGDISAAAVGGRASIASASGDVRIQEASETDVSTASGDVKVVQAEGDVSARSASGDLYVQSFDGSRLAAKSMSGDVIVGVAGGRTYEVSLASLSGDIKTDFPVVDRPSGAVARLEIKTVSGDVLVRAAKS